MIDKDLYRSPSPRLRDFWQPRYWAGWFAYGMFRLFSLLPHRLIWWFGAVIGEFAFRFHRTTTIKLNLAMCFPELDETARERLRRRYYHNAGRVFMALGFSWFGSEARYRRLCSFTGQAHLDVLRASGKGVLFLAPHFVALEAGGIRLQLEYPFIGLYRKPRNPMLHQALRAGMTHLGGLVVERYENLRPVIKAVREGYFLYYLPDQDPDREDDDFVFAPFFAIPTATYTAYARLARLMNAAVVPITTVITPRGYEIRIDAPLQDFPVGDDLADAARLNAVIERMVRAVPEQYLWSYRRFKTRPDGAPSPYGPK
jgi:lauroyl/myristoyl acyltransferase